MCNYGLPVKHHTDGYIISRKCEEINCRRIAVVGVMYDIFIALFQISFDSCSDDCSTSSCNLTKNVLKYPYKNFLVSEPRQGLRDYTFERSKTPEVRYVKRQN